jgi:hypothetical protein
MGGTVTRRPWPHITRDTVLFVCGLVGILHETFIRTGDTRPEFLMLFAGMVGLPVALRRDEARGAGTDADDDAATPTLGT